MQVYQLSHIANSPSEAPEFFLIIWLERSALFSHFLLNLHPLVSLTTSHAIATREMQCPVPGSRVSGSPTILLLNLKETSLQMESGSQWQSELIGRLADSFTTCRSQPSSWNILHSGSVHTPLICFFHSTPRSSQSWCHLADDHTQSSTGSLTDSSCQGYSHSVKKNLSVA